MNIFISVYHAVRAIFLLPKKLFTSNKDKKLKKEKDKEQQDRIARIQEEIKQQAKGIDNKSTTDKTKETTEDGLDSLIERKRVAFDYIVKNDMGQTLKGSFDALSESEVKAFLINEGYEIVSISPQKKMNMEIRLPGFGKMKAGEISFALTQLSTYIRAGIPLIDSVRILAKQTSKPDKRKIYDRIVYDLVTGESFSSALEHQSDVFPRLLINMVKTSEMTGDLPSVLDEMSEYYTSIEESKKQMMSALTYPLVVLCLTIVVLVFCLIYIVPSFTSMYDAGEKELPAITQFTMAMSGFATNYWYLLLLGLIIIIIAYQLAYHNIKSFKKTMQTFFMKLPIIGNIIIYNEVNMFTKTFASLLNHSVNISDSMDILSKISNNEIYKEIIMNTLDTLSKGGKISTSFRGHWAFPVVAYEMLVTGESTGQLGTMMEKVSVHFGNLHKNMIGSIKSLIEPITLVILAFAVGFILISIIVPMFGMYETIT